MPDPSSAADLILNAQKEFHSMTLSDRINNWAIASQPDNPPVPSVADVRVTPERNISASREFRRNDVDPDGNLITRVDHERSVFEFLTCLQKTGSETGFSAQNLDRLLNRVFLRAKFETGKQNRI